MAQPQPSAEITTLRLKAWCRGDEKVLDRLTPLVYDHLRKLARQYVRKERPDGRMDAAALVHEAYVRWEQVDHSTMMNCEQLPATNTDRAAEIVKLDDALNSLAQLDPRRAQVVELRFFNGLSVEETADALSVSPHRDARLETGARVARTGIATLNLPQRRRARKVHFAASDLTNAALNGQLHESPV